MPKSRRRPQQKRPQNVPMNAAPAAGTPQATAPAAPRATSATARQVLTGAARHPFIAGELKRIGIMTGVVLVILIVLAFALPRFI